MLESLLENRRGCSFSYRECPLCQAGDPLVLCSVCGSSTVLRFHLEEYPVFECPTCKHRFTRLQRSLDEHLATTYSDAYFTSGGAGYPSYVSAAPVLARHAAQYCRLLERHGVTTGKLLDVGCAAGFHLHQFVRRGWQGVGIEPNATLAAFGRDQLGLEIINAGIEKAGDGVLPGPFTLILMVQVLAHLVEPHAALTLLLGKLEPGGHLLIETWDYQSRTARLFGRRWHEYSPPSVLQWFCRRSLFRLLHGHGLTVVASGRPDKRLQWRHARALIEYKLPTGARRVFRAVSAPIPPTLEIHYPGDDILWVLAQRPPGHGVSSAASAGPVPES